MFSISNETKNELMRILKKASADFTRMCDAIERIDQRFGIYSGQINDPAPAVEPVPPPDTTRAEFPPLRKGMPWIRIDAEITSMKNVGNTDGLAILMDSLVVRQKAIAALVGGIHDEAERKQLLQQRDRCFKRIKSIETYLDGMPR